MLILCGALLLATSQAVPAAMGPGDPSDTVPAFSRLIPFDDQIEARVRDALRSGLPFAVSTVRCGNPLPSVRPLPDYERVAGVLLAYRSRDGGSRIVAELASLVTADPENPVETFVLVRDEGERRLALDTFARAGADLAQVRFFFIDCDSIWIRDFGPIFVDSPNGIAMIDPIHLRWRPRDDVATHRLASAGFGPASSQSGLRLAGGNLQVDSAGNGFTTSLLFRQNRDLGFPYLLEQLADRLGIRRLHVFPPLPPGVDPTGHLDMWFQVVQDGVAVVAEFSPGSDPEAIRITESASVYLETQGFQVHRVPGRVVAGPGGRPVHYSYANALRVNDRLFVPEYRYAGIPEALNQRAREDWRKASGMDVLPIESSALIHAGGALHCIARQVPFAGGSSRLRILEPEPGAIVMTGEELEVGWGAPPGAVLDLLTARFTPLNARFGSGGFTELPIFRAGTDRSGGTLTVPDLAEGNYVLSLSAEDPDGSRQTSDRRVGRLSRSRVRTYDFESGPARLWESPVLRPEDLMQRRVPAEALEVPRARQSGLFQSDAVEAGWLGPRYRSRQPAYGLHSATVFEFDLAEPVARAIEVHLRWEGYGDDAAPVEFYVWDYRLGHWGDGRGSVGRDRYLDIRSGLEDFVLKGRLRRDLDRFFGPGRPLTLLILADRSDAGIFHDHLRVRVLH